MLRGTIPVTHRCRFTPSFLARGSNPRPLPVRPHRTFALTLQARLWFLDKKWSYPGGFTAEKEVQRRRTLAAWIRENLLELGPTFIKARLRPKAAQCTSSPALRSTDVVLPLFQRVKLAR